MLNSTTKLLQNIVVCPSVISGNKKNQYKVDFNWFICNVKYMYISLTYMYMVRRLDKIKMNESENQNQYLELSIVLY